jgi:hypothetical protein
LLTRRSEEAVGVFGTNVSVGASTHVSGFDAAAASTITSL